MRYVSHSPDICELCLTIGSHNLITVFIGMTSVRTADTSRFTFFVGCFVRICAQVKYGCKQWEVKQKVSCVAVFVP